MFFATSNLIADKSEGIEKIAWTVYGKVARVIRKAKITSTTPASTNLLENYDDVIIEYSYDAMGNRISKTVKRREGLAYNEIVGWTAGTDFLGTEKTTYYVRDAQGNVLSIYDKGAYVKYRNTATLPNITWLVTPILADVLAPVPVRGTAAANNKPAPFPALPLALSEQIIYGSARIGAYKPQRNQKLLATDPNRGKIMPILVGQLTLGYKSYELSNHLGNVLTTISDNKMMVQASGLVYLQAIVLTTQDYYPFGKGMSERSYVNVDRNAQRYGFNGKENDEEWGKTVQDYGFRIYNPELGKFVSVDPLTQSYPWYTPYQFAGNKPIHCIDLDGAEEEVVIHSAWWSSVIGHMFSRITDSRRLITDPKSNTVFMEKAAIYVANLTRYLKEKNFRFTDNYAVATLDANPENRFAVEATSSSQLATVGLDLVLKVWHNPEHTPIVLDDNTKSYYKVMKVRVFRYMTKEGHKGGLFGEGVTLIGQGAGDDGGLGKSETTTMIDWDAIQTFIDAFNTSGEDGQRSDANALAQSISDLAQGYDDFKKEMDDTLKNLDPDNKQDKKVNVVVGGGSNAIFVSKKELDKFNLKEGDKITMEKMNEIETSRTQN